MPSYIVPVVLLTADTRGNKPRVLLVSTASAIGDLFLGITAEVEAGLFVDHVKSCRATEQLAHIEGIGI